MSAMAQTRPRRRSLGNGALTTAAILVFCFLYIPLAVIVLYSFSGSKVNIWPIPSYTTQWYSVMWHDPAIRSGISLSFRIGLIAAFLAIVLGTLAAMAIDRFDFHGKGLMRFFIVLPITLPGIVTGVAMLITGVVSSRIGAKKTLLAGLAIIIVFASAVTPEAARRLLGLR
ncbi:MAG TPA: hypothetical protein PK819_13985, partial [Thermomicrobiales bacterium]|nr:hypothetical protein [Thermomicrobiales bacterium]